MIRCFRGNLLSRNHTSKNYFSSPEGRANWEMGVTVKEHEGAEHWEAWRYQCRGFQQPLAWVHNQGYLKRQNRREKIKGEEYAHQDQDGARGSGLMGSSRGMAVAVNVLYSLLMPVQDEDHKTTRPGHEAEIYKNQWRRWLDVVRQQVCLEWVNYSIYKFSPYSCFCSFLVQ